MTWFERLWGCKEPRGQEEIEALFELKDTELGMVLKSKVNGRSALAGRLGTPTLQTVRAQFLELSKINRDRGFKTQLSEHIGDVQQLHKEANNEGATFQVASQVNLLEMASPHAAPIDGVEIYEYDRTQGPACAISAGGGTVYRNYFYSHGHHSRLRGQLEEQVNTLDELHKGLIKLLLSSSMVTADHVDNKQNDSYLWATKNGYVLPNSAQLTTINTILQSLNHLEREELMGLCKIGLHTDVEVTLGDAEPSHCVTQAYCSALPLGYSREPSSLWEPFARLVLEAAYEHTLKSAAISLAQGGSPLVYLTRIGGGVFKNPDDWINSAIRRALDLVSDQGLVVKLVSYGQSQHETRSLVDQWSA